jgi:hypothetical protein
MTVTILREADTNNKIIPGFVQENDTVHSKIIMQSEGEIRELARCSNVTLHLDCTGGIIKGAQKHNYLYHALVYQRVKRTPPIPAISMVTKKNTSYCIEDMLAPLLNNYSKVHGTDLAPKCIVTDHSFANLHAIVAAFKLGNLPDYLDKVWNLTDEEEPDFPLIKLCKAHFMKTIAMRCKKNYPGLKPKDRRIIMVYFAHMIKAHCKDDLYRAFRDLAKILQSPFIGEEVRRLLDPDHCIDLPSDYVEPTHAVVVENIGRYRDKCSAGRKFTSVAEEVRENLSHKGATSTSNHLYSPKMIEDLLTFYMPFTPLWCGVHGGTETNGLVEGWHKIVKCDILQRKRTTPGSFVRTMYKQTCARVAESAADYKIKETKRKTKEGAKEYEERWSKKTRNEKPSYTSEAKSKFKLIQSTRSEDEQIRKTKDSNSADTLTLKKKKESQTLIYIAQKNSSLEKSQNF